MCEPENGDLVKGSYIEGDLTSSHIQNVTYFNEDTSIHESVQVSEDLKNMAKYNIIDSALQQKMYQQQKSFTTNYPPQLNQCFSKLKNQITLSKERMKSISTVKKFNPFVEVITSSNKNF